MPPTRRSRLRFNAAAGRYQDRQGRFVNAATVRRDLDRALDESARAVAALADELRARRISLGEWELRMRAEVKTVQLYSAAVAKGGLAQLTSADLGRVGRETREQYAYLRNFALQIQAGLHLDGRFRRRTAMYAQAGRGLFHRVERSEMARRGYTHESNVLAASDHCDGCVGETARGPVPIGELVPIGQRTCLSGCRCRVAYHRSADDARAA